MSDYQVDARWWIASDGKWYPPDATGSGGGEIRYPDTIGSSSETTGETWQPPVPSPTLPSDPLLAPRTPSSVDPNSWRTLQDQANQVSELVPHYLQVLPDEHRSVFDEPGLSPLPKGWEFAWGKAALKGLRTERQASTYLIGALVLLAYYAGFAALVIYQMSNFEWVFLALPGLMGLFLWRVFSRLWDTRATEKESGIKPTRDTPRQVRQLRWAVRIAVGAFALGVVGNAIFWGHLAANLWPRNSTCSYVELTNPKTGMPFATVPASGSAGAGSGCQH